METMHARRDIPTDVVLYHILPRLPVTSLQRFRSVCKQWYSFLKTRTFANIHTHLVTIGDHQPKPKLLVLSRTKSTSYTPSENQFRIIDCEALDDASGDSLPFPFKDNLNDFRIMSSLHGLVCVDIGYGDLVLWNPLTGQYKNVIRNNLNMKFYRIALGMYYSTCEDDYKLLTVSSDNSVYIYSLKSESWRMVDSTHNYQTLSDLGIFPCWGVSTWLNGDLYFLCHGFYTGYSIIKFDTKVERFTVIPTHPCINGLDNISHMSMTVKRGVIHLGVKYVINRDENTYIQLWRMIRDGNWKKVGAQYRADRYMDPLHWIRNKTWLMINNKLEHHLCKVDLSRKWCTGKGKCKDETFSCTCIINTGISSQTVVNYTETFMSLDR